MAYEVREGLREYDGGFLEGRSDEAAWQVWQELFEDWTLHKRWEQRIEGGESFYEVRERFVPFIEELIHQYGESEEGVVCVSHVGIYWMMLPMLMRNEDHEWMGQFGFGYTTCIRAEARPEALMCVEWDGVKI